jgi:sodium bicarbonate transporter 10
MRKIPPGAEASNILVGEVDFLEKTVSAFVRLNHATLVGGLTEVPVPTRFIFVLLGPTVSILQITSAFSKLNKGLRISA